MKHNDPLEQSYDVEDFGTFTLSKLPDMSGLKKVERLGLVRDRITKASGYTAEARLDAIEDAILALIDMERATAD